MFHALVPQVNTMSEEQKEKILAMSKTDMPIAERRKTYNALNRRIGRGSLKPGLAEKYFSATDEQKWEMAKHFLVDPDMLFACISPRCLPLSNSF